MKVIKPDNLALLYRSIHFAQRNPLAVGMLACFDFNSESSLQAAPTPESELWATAALALNDALLDEGYPKPAGEFKVYGAACAPTGAEVEQLRVSVRLGALAKSLVVSGDRHFNAFGMASKPQPYARMPITQSTAFGGPGCDDNPRGKGYAALEGDGQQTWLLPNVEHESKRILSRGERAAPAGFWGFDACAPQRRQHLGACDAHWLEHGWPHLPADTLPEFFHSAPPDQRLAGFFAGDETFEIGNMHPTHSRLQGRLPGLRARCFLNTRANDGAERLREFEAKAETVWLFPELERGIVLYRALAEVADVDAADVLHMMTAWEWMNEPPLPFEHYQAEFLRSLPVAVDAEAAPAAVDAVASAPEVAESGAAMPASAAPAAPLAEMPLPEGFAAAYAMAADLDRQTQALMAKHGLTEKDLARFLEPAPEPPVLSFAEIEKMAGDLDAQTRALMRKHNLTDADLAPFLKAPQEPVADIAEVQRLLLQVHAETQATLTKAGLTEADVHAWVATRPDLADFAKSLPPPGSPPSQLDPATLAWFAAAPDMPPPPDLHMPEAPAAAPPEPLAAVPLTREDVVVRHAARQGFAGYDLSGLDLSGLDLTGANFSEALLEKTSFAKSRLQDADFSLALLKETDFTEADLQRAQLVKTSGGGGCFAGADLRSAQLVEGDFSDADFSAARLDGADLSGAQFDRAAMPGVGASGCRALGAQLTACVLDGADFSGGMLAQASFSGSSLKGVNFTGADCAQVDFYGAQAADAVFVDTDLSASRADGQTCFERAQFVRARMNRAAWDGAQLHGAVFEHANLDDADLSNVAARAATFRRVSARNAKFSKADLTGADLTGINLFKGSLRRAKLDGARICHANLYGVDFDETRPTLAGLEGSNIDRTILKFRPPVV